MKNVNWRLLVTIGFVLLGAALVGCDGGGTDVPDAQELPDAGVAVDTLSSPDVLTLIDTGSPKADVIVATSCPLPAGSSASGITFAITTGTVVCTDPAYSQAPYAGISCEQLAAGGPDSIGERCCVPSGRSTTDPSRWDLVSYNSVTKLWEPSLTAQPYCGERTPSPIKYALCSEDGRFIGWSCVP